MGEDPLPVIDFAPGFVAPILSGAKMATTRLLRAEPQLRALCHTGTRAQATHGSAAGVGGRVFAVLRVTGVEHATVGGLIGRDELARAEGLESGAVLQGLIRRFYPDVADEETLAILHFRVEAEVEEPPQ